MTSDEQPLDLGILLAVGYQEFVRQLRAELAARGHDDLGSNDGYVLRALDGNPLTVSALAERLEITKQGAAQIVDAMQERGYVERHPDPTDGRARLLHLAPRGKQALSVARRFHRAFERDLAKRHGADAVAQLRFLLNDIAGAESAPNPRLRASYI